MDVNQPKLDEVTLKRAEEVTRKILRTKETCIEEEPEEPIQDNAPDQPGILSATGAAATAAFAVAGAAAVVGATRLGFLTIAVTATILVSGAVLSKLTHKPKERPNRKIQARGRNGRDSLKGLENLIADFTVQEISGDVENKVEVEGCILTIPKGAFEGSCEIRVFTMFHDDLCPEGYTSATAFVDVDLPKTLMAPVRVQIESLASISRSEEPIEVDLLHLADDSDSWEVLNTMPLTDNSKLEFNCMEFSPILVGIKEKFLKYVRFPLKTSLTFREGNAFILHAYLHHSLAEKRVREYWKMPHTQIMDFNIFIIKLWDKIVAELSIRTHQHDQMNFPDSFKLLPSGVIPFSFDRKFLHAKFMNTYGVIAAKDADQKQVWVPIYYSVENNGTRVDGIHCFNYVWKPPERSTEMVASLDRSVVDISNVRAEGSSTVVYNQYGGINIAAAQGAQVHMSTPQSEESQQGSSARDQ